MTSFGSAAAGAVATAYAFPRSPRAASRSDFGSPFDSFGSTSESGDSGTPSSPTAVLSANRPATPSSESSVAAVTRPVVLGTRSKLTDCESPGAMYSIDCDGSPTRVAPLMLRPNRFTDTKLAGLSPVFVTVTSSV